MNSLLLLLLNSHISNLYVIQFMHDFKVIKQTNNQTTELYKY